jgi:hypothetical protein
LPVRPVPYPPSPRQTPTGGGWRGTRFGVGAPSATRRSSSTMGG